MRWFERPKKCAPVFVVLWVNQMKLLTIISTLLFYSIANAQEISKCPFALYNWKNETKYSESYNNKYLAIGDMRGIRVFQEEKNNFDLISKINKSIGPGSKMHFSGNGVLVVWGDSFTDTQSDIINIYDKHGEIQHSIDAEKILSEIEVINVIKLYKNINNCTPKKPWICWEEEVWFEEDNIMHLVDALGRDIEINILTGESMIHAGNKKCVMFP